MYQLDSSGGHGCFDLGAGLLSKVPHNTDPQSRGLLPTAKNEHLFFNHVQSPSPSFHPPSPTASSSRRFRSTSPHSTLSPSSYCYQSHIPFKMTGPIRTKDVVDSRPPSTSEPAETLLATGPSSSSSSSKPSRSKNPPRPLNAWIIYRKQKMQLILQNDDYKRLPQSEVSKMVSKMWREETREGRAQFEFAANLSKEQHQRAYPGYQFRPQKKADKEKERAERKKELDRERAEKKLAKQNKRSSASNAVATPSSSTSAEIAQGDSSTPEPGGIRSTMVERYGDCGPSPPLSGVPSPFGSPRPDNFSLDAGVAHNVLHQDAFTSSCFGLGSTPVAQEQDVSRQASVPHEQVDDVAQLQSIVSNRPPTTSGWEASLHSATELSAHSGQSYQLGLAQAVPSSLGDGALFAQSDIGTGLNTDLQQIYYNGVTEHDSLRQWINESNPAVHGGYEHTEIPTEDAPPSSTENRSNTNDFFALRVDTASLGIVPPGEIQVAPENQYADPASLPSALSDPSNNVLGLDLAQLGTDDFTAFTNFLNSFPLLPGESKNDFHGEPLLSDSSASSNSNNDFNFDFASNSNVHLPGSSNMNPFGPPEVPHSRFVSNGQYDFGEASAVGSDLLGWQDAQGVANPTGDAFFDPTAFLSQSPSFPSSGTDTSPVSAGSADLQATYAPPAGAMNTSMRRAAGTWRPPANLQVLNDE